MRGSLIAMVVVGVGGLVLLVTTAQPDRLPRYAGLIAFCVAVGVVVPIIAIWSRRY